MYKQLVLVSLICVAQPVIHKAKKGDIPYIVSLNDTANHHQCSAVILDSEWMLTTTQCVEKNSDIDFNGRIVAGTVNLTLKSDFVSRIAEIRKSGNFSLVRLRSPLPFNRWYLEPVCIGELEDGEKEVEVSGWPSANDTLHFAFLETTEQCPPYQICVKRKANEACLEDSGGPVMSVDTRWLVGMNFGECDSDGQYFTRLSIYEDAIRKRFKYV